MSDLELAMLVQDFPRTRVFNLSKQQALTVSGFQCLCSLPTLTELDLSECSGTALSIIFRSSSAITALNLSNCGITNEEMPMIVTAAPHLTSLDLSRSPDLSPVGLGFLDRLKKMRFLNLAECGARLVTADAHIGVTNAIVEKVSRLSELRALNLASSEFDDSGIRSLRSLPKLRELNLSNCGEISDAGVKQLLDTEALETINLTKCRRVTFQGVYTTKELRRCFVTHNGSCIIA
jgi:Leucine-rich repeat (LRR) protein